VARVQTLDSRPDHQWNITEVFTACLSTSNLATTPPLARQLAAMTSRSTEARKRRPDLVHPLLHGHKGGSSLRTFNQTALGWDDGDGDDDDDDDSNDSETPSIATDSHSASQSVTEGVEKLTVKYVPHRETSSVPENARPTKSLSNIDLTSST
jgi:hypothetical protein